MKRKWSTSMWHGFLVGAGIALGFITTTAVAVTVGTTFTSGDTLTAASLNALKSAIESIPDWVKGTTAGDAVYMAGNVGIGVAAPTESLELGGNLAIGKALSTDDEFIYFQNGVEYLKYDYVDDRFEISGDFQIEGSTPELEFEDTSTGAVDFDIYVNSNKLHIQYDETPVNSFMTIWVPTAPVSPAPAVGYTGFSNTSPVSTLQVGDTLDDATTHFLQVDTLAGTLATDCSTTDQAGRMYLDVTNNLLWICNARSGIRGWDSIALTD